MLDSHSPYDRLPVKYPPLSPQDLDTFLDGKWVAYLATTSRDGSPHVKPIWYMWDREALWMITWLKCKTVTNLEHDGRVAVTIQEGGEPVTSFPKQGVLIHGTAELIPEMKTENDPNSWHFKIFSRYLGEEACLNPPLSEHLSSPDMAIKVTPTNVISWDYRQG